MLMLGRASVAQTLLSVLMRLAQSVLFTTFPDRAAACVLRDDPRAPDQPSVRSHPTVARRVHPTADPRRSPRATRLRLLPAPLPTASSRWRKPHQEGCSLNEF